MAIQRGLLTASVLVPLVGILIQNIAIADATEPPQGVYIGPGDVVLIEPGRETCGTIVLNADGEYEAAFHWQYDGVQPPYYGAFAECYTVDGEVCAAVFDFTRADPPAPGRLDAYVWADQAGEPGEVTCMVAGVDPGPIASWPMASRHSIPLPDGCCVSGDWWVGYWPEWPGNDALWSTTADLDLIGCPFTNIAPGIGFPTGWQNVSVVWGPHGSLGIGAEVIPCEPTPIVQSTWGRIKTLYSRL